MDAGDSNIKIWNQSGIVPRAPPELVNFLQTSNTTGTGVFRDNCAKFASKWEHCTGIFLISPHHILWQGSCSSSRFFMYYLLHWLNKVSSDSKLSWLYLKMLLWLQMVKADSGQCMQCTAFAIYSVVEHHMQDCCYWIFHPSIMQNSACSPVYILQAKKWKECFSWVSGRPV